jgi:hypothetical protein
MHQNTQIAALSRAASAAVGLPVTASSQEIEPTLPAPDNPFALACQQLSQNTTGPMHLYKVRVCQAPSRHKALP